MEPCAAFFSQLLFGWVLIMSAVRTVISSQFLKIYYFFLDESFCILVSYDANSLIAIYVFDQILIDWEILLTGNP